MKKLSILISLLITINVYSQRINGGLGLTGPTGPTGPAGSSNANNGCTLYGDSVGLGGSLSQETKIDANGNILYIGDVVTNTGLHIEPPYAGIFAESAAFLEAVNIYNNCDTFQINTKNASIISDTSFIVSSKVINFSNTDNFYTQTNTDSGFNTSLFLSPVNTIWSNVCRFSSSL